MQKIHRTLKLKIRTQRKFIFYKVFLYFIKLLTCGYLIGKLVVEFRHPCEELFLYLFMVNKTSHKEVTEQPLSRLSEFYYQLS